MMRIITGSARGVRLDAPAGRDTRPTTERAKEGVFSYLQFELDGRRVLDLFAGSGQMGLEALSRGADSAVFVDMSPEAVNCIRKNIEKARMGGRASVRQEDYARFLGRADGDRFGLVFLDPPYAMRVFDGILESLSKNGCLTPDARIVIESDREDLFGGGQTLPQGYRLRRHLRYGICHFDVLDYDPERGTV